jgi:hypothetical protein
LAILPDSAIKKLIFEKVVSFCFHWFRKDNKMKGKQRNAYTAIRKARRWRLPFLPVRF